MEILNILHGPVNYVIYNGNKIYKDATGFYSINNKFEKQYYEGIEKQKIIDTFGTGDLLSNSAQEYYKDAYNFSVWVHNNLSDINQTHAVDPLTGNKITDFKTNTGTSSIFDCTTITTYGKTGIEGTIFDINRMEVIRRSITTNLISSIANFNSLSTNLSFEFVLPKFTEEEWYNITNNIAVISFMQGMSIGSKYYNDYCIIINNKNKELINLNTLNVATTDGEMHFINCKDLIDKNLTINNVYKSLDFERKINIIYDASSITNKVYRYHFSQYNLRCYDCMVGPSNTYKIDFLQGTIQEYNPITENYDNVTDATKIARYNTLREKVIHALARERYDLYKINGYFGS